jgi:hypothetical protein
MDSNGDGKVDLKDLEIIATKLLTNPEELER